MFSVFGEKKIKSIVMVAVEYYIPHGVTLGFCSYIMAVDYLISY